MYYFKWALRLFFFAIVAVFLHYTLPQRDIVQIVQAETRITTFNGWTRMFYAQPDAGEAETASRDVRYIRAVRANERPIEYRNEDTGVFGWPPYFKINSDTIQTRAATAAAQQTGEQWFIVRHYGWRWNYPTIFPNVLSITPADGPDQRLIPYFNIAVILILFGVYWAIAVRLKRFRQRRIDPLFDDE